MKSRFIIILVLQTIMNSAIAQSTGDYRSKQSGAWTTAASWQTYDGSSWVNAVAYPSSANGVITILATHIITFDGTLAADQVVVNTNGSLNINSGTFTVNDGTGTDINCNGTIILAGATMDGAGTAIFGTGSIFDWSGGTNSGSGSITINADATMKIDGSDVVLNGTKTINNYGALTWTSGTISFGSTSPVINNYGTFNIYTDADVSGFGSSGSFNNKLDGSINKIGSPNDETAFSGTITFVNEGAINVASSKLKINIGTTNTGTIGVSFGATMTFAGNTTANFNTGTVISGTGSLSLEAGNKLMNVAGVSINNLIVTGGTVTVTPDLIFGDGATLSVTGGTLNANGNITLNSGSNLSWTGGKIGGSGVLLINANATVSINGDNLYLADSKIINNYGTMEWLNGYLYFDSGTPSINNYGTFNISTDYDQYGSGSLNNKSTGVINKIGSPTDETSINGASFINEGTINVNSSKLKPYISTLNTGNVNIAFSANMNFRGSSTFNTGSVFAGAGSLGFDGGGALINAASISVANINITGGTVTLTPSIAINNGSTLNLSAGSLIGTGNITFNTGSTFNWSGGINGGSGAMTINSGAVFNMTGGTHSISGTKIINNYSTWSWNGGDIYFSNGDPVVNNYGILNINTDDDIIQFNTTADAFNNMASGIINKEGSATEETAITNTTAFNNAGIIHIISGNLEINTTGTHTGNYEIDFGGQLNGSITMAFTGNSFINNGTVDITGLNFSGSLIQTLDGEGFISRTTIVNGTGIHLIGTQTVTTTITIIPNSKLKVFGHLIVL